MGKLSTSIFLVLVGVLCFGLNVNAMTTTGEDFNTYDLDVLNGQGDWNLLSGDETSVNVVDTCGAISSTRCAKFDSSSAVTMYWDFGDDLDDTDAGWLYMEIYAPLTTNPEGGHAYINLSGLSPTSTVAQFFYVGFYDEDTYGETVVTHQQGTDYQYTDFDPDELLTVYYLWDNEGAQLQLVQNSVQILYQSVSFQDEQEWINPSRFYISSALTTGGNDRLAYVDNISIQGLLEPETTVFDYLEDQFVATSTIEVTAYLDTICNKPFFLYVCPALDANFPFNIFYDAIEAISDTQATTSEAIITLTLPTTTPITGSFELFSENTFNRYLGESNLSLMKNIIALFLWLSYFRYIYVRTRDYFDSNYSVNVDRPVEDKPKWGFYKLNR